MRRRFLSAVLGVTCSAGVCLLACSSDDETTTPTGGVDAGNGDTSTTPPDGGSKADTGSPGVDSGTNDATTTDSSTSDSGVDAGPTRTTETKSTGLIHLAGTYAIARFSEDDTIVRWSNAPECIMIARSATKPYSTAGTVTIGGQVVGQDGGPPAEVELNAPDYVSDQFFLPPTAEFTVDVSEGPANPGFPALTKQTIRPSLGTPVTVNGPLPDAGTLHVPADTAFTLTWTVPSGEITEQRFAVDLVLFPSGADGSRNVEVICDTKLSDGKFTLPAELMGDALAQTAPVSGTPASAQLTLFAGGQKTIPVKNAVYVITAAPDESTTLPAATSVSIP